jgi:hypothetical protein
MPQGCRGAAGRVHRLPGAVRRARGGVRDAAVRARVPRRVRRQLTALQLFMPLLSLPIVLDDLAPSPKRCRKC